MGFSKDVKEKALIAAARHCCVCQKSAGLNIEVHHIIQSADGGEDSFENAIPLCFDCHANAGHYNHRHPKGTKYSVNELRGHRDKWYETVKLGSLNLVEEPIMDINYLLISDIDGVKEILDGNSSRIKIEDSMLFSNDIMNFWVELIGKNEFWFNRKYGKDIENARSSYEGTSRDVLTLIDTPSKDELDEVSPLVDYLNLNDVDIDKYCRKYIYYCACGDSTHEYYEFRDFTFLFTALRNTSDCDVYLSDLSYKTIKEFELYSMDNVTPDEEAYSMPPVAINAGMTLLIPSGILLKQFKSDGYNVTTLSSDRVEGYIDNRINKFVDEKSLSYSFSVGKTIIPTNLSFRVKNDFFNQSLRMIDLNNLYLIDREFMIGSCPHLLLFTETNNHYIGELFSNNSQENSVERIRMKKSGILKVYEIEDEVTYIDEVYINGKLYSSNIILNKGDTFHVSCLKDDEIEFHGRYELLYDKKYYSDDPIFKGWKLSNSKGVPFNFA